MESKEYGIYRRIIWWIERTLKLKHRIWRSHSQDTTKKRILLFLFKLKYKERNTRNDSVLNYQIFIV